MKSIITIALCLISFLGFSQTGSVKVSLSVQTSTDDVYHYQLIQKDSVIRSGTFTSGNDDYFHSDYKFYKLELDSLENGTYQLAILLGIEEQFRWTKIKVYNEEIRLELDMEEGEVPKIEPVNKHGGVGNREFEYFFRGAFPFMHDLERVSSRYQWGGTFTNWFELAGERRLQLGVSSAVFADQLFLNRDTTVRAMNVIEKEYLSSAKFDMGLHFRVSNFNSNTNLDSLQNAVSFDIGVVYRVPFSLRYKVKNEQTKVTERIYKNYNWNELALQARFAVHPFSLQVEYQLAERIVDGYPLYPRLSLGVTFLLNDNLVD